jgi:protein SEY1
MMNMANAASSQALEEGKKRLREFLESSDTGRQAMGMTVGNERDGAGAGYEMKRMNGGRRGMEAKTDGVGSEDEG